MGIIGKNGSGKSTLLTVISKIYSPDEGEVRTDGRVIGLLRLGTGFHPDLSGRENIYMNASILGFKKNHIDEMYDEIVEFSELEKFIDTPIRNYSSGMKARLGFSIAINVNPEILLLDEIAKVEMSERLSFENKLIKIRPITEKKSWIDDYIRNEAELKKTENRKSQVEEAIKSIKKKIEVMPR